MRKFVDKKREMFLVQMMLDIKREEILKLEEYAQLREAGLRRSEEMIDNDIETFNKFWDSVKKQSHEKIQEAEAANKQKQDCIMEIKKLQEETQRLNNSLTKNQALKSEYSQYKEFLDNITPAQLMEQIQQYKDSRKKNNSSSLKLEPVKEESSEDEQDNITMHFQESEQLLDQFRYLERQNLFLIQITQEYDQELEESLHKFQEIKEQYEEKIKEQKINKQILEKAIAEEQKKIDALQQANKGAQQGENYEQLTNGLTETITGIYIASCSGEQGQTWKSMLTHIEFTLDEHLREYKSLQIKELDLNDPNRDANQQLWKDFKDIVNNKEKARRQEKQRRQNSEQKQKDKEQREKSIQRLLNAKPKTYGKPIMQRSKLPDKKREKRRVATPPENKYWSEFLEENI